MQAHLVMFSREAQASRNGGDVLASHARPQKPAKNERSVSEVAHGRPLLLLPSANVQACPAQRSLSVARSKGCKRSRGHTRRNTGARIDTEIDGEKRPLAEEGMQKAEDRLSNERGCVVGDKVERIAH